MARKKKITLQQKKFIDELFIDYNQSAAAIRAGYSPRSAASIASELMANPDIQELVELRRAQLSSRTGSSVERIKNELSAMAYVNPKNFFKKTESGDIELKNMMELSDEDAAAIQEITITKGKNGVTTKIKVYEKKGPLELLGKTENMFKENVNINVKSGLAGKMEAARKRVKQNE